MATAVSARPAGPPSNKVKRPVPPALQTAPNGIGSQSSPSPSLSSKRPPSGYKHPPSAGIITNGGHATPNSSVARSNRRKDSQKIVDGNRPRLNKTSTSEIMNGERRPSKKIQEPFVKTTSYLLKRYRKSAPSFIVHLHPTHFRFDQQDGSFSYNSPARKLLEHIKDQTMPHDMIDEFHQAGIKFYEGCLIVQVYDHRNNRKDITSSSSSLKEDRNQPYSIHNYNQYLTPSPHVPYPSTKLQDAAESSSRPSSAKQGESSQNALSTNKDAEQEDLASKSSSGPRIFTTVLFPTALSFQEDVVKCAVTPDPRSLNRKGSQIGNSRSSAPGAASGSSATSSGSGPAAKRQKLQFSNHSLQTIEANMILATAPPLYLDPVKDVKEAQALLDKLNDPHCNREHPAPKSRKRTVAELAADEALAAEEQRFMLIMDERIGGGSGAMNTGKGVGTDNEGSSTNFEANFERFKVLEEIKELNKEKKEREAQHTAQAKAKAEQDRAQERAQLANVRRQEQQEQMMRNQALRQTGGPQQLLHAQQQASVQQQGSGGPAPHAHPPTTAAMIGSHQLATTQASQSSPVARNGTPLNVSSPAVGQAPKRSGSAVPMKLTNSAQGAGSPPRPGSALQHGHPAPIPMAIQRSQQPPSRNGTPAMPNGTPRLQQGTPDIRNVTPTPRMSQASPVNSVATAATPMMGHNMIGATHMNGQQQLTPQQQQQHAAFLRAQQQQNQARQQALMAQAYHQQQQMHGSPQNIQMHQIQQQQIAAAHQAQQRAAMQPQDPEAYRHSIQSHHMNQGQSSSPAMMAMMGRGAGQHPFGNQQGGNLSMGATVNERTRQQLTHAAARSFESLRQQAMQQYGPNIPPEIIANLRTQASNAAKHWFANQQRRVMQQQHQHQQTLLNQIHQNGAMNGMGSM